MNHTHFKKFTLEEANRLLPQIIELTRNIVEQLDEEQRRFEAEKIFRGADAEAALQKIVNKLLDEWANQIVALGVMPKGFFTCDFVTPNPERFFCWNFGEHKISHTHKVTESFKDRVPMRNPELQGFEVSLN